MKKCFAILLTTFGIAFLTGCVEPVDPEPEELAPLVTSLVVNDNWVFQSRPTITIHAENSNSKPMSAEAKVVITTDKKAEVTTLAKTVEIAADSGADIVFTTESDLAPGFYRASCKVNGQGASIQLKGGKTSTVVFGISPEKIVSAPDKQADFDAFWEAAKAQLAAIDMKPNLIEISSRSNAACKVYLVEFQSVPDGPSGDPVTVRGYYCEPQDGKKHPVLMHFFGYDSQNVAYKLDCPYGSANPEYAEFYLSHRGQYINNRKAQYRVEDGLGDLVNTYGDWFAFNFGNRDGYYYRGAFMDCVQAVRFMATRPSSDISKLFAEGSSQGGALSYAAAALSDYPFTAIAPCVAFLGDFPDYFQIVGWPGNTAKENQGSMTDAQMYEFLSYFDTKNLATRISCAVLACSGLQDETCPPHTNVAPFNNLKSTDKQYYYYPTMQHEIPSDWSSKWSKFFKERMK